VQEMSFWLLKKNSKNSVGIPNSMSMEDAEALLSSDVLVAA